MGKFSGKVALVVGGATGIGRATATLLAAQGAKVVIGDRNEGGAFQAVEAIKKAGGKAKAVGADISKEGDIVHLIDETISAFGQLNILHNNAALTAPEIVARDGDIASMEAELWDQVMAVNLRGAMLIAKHAIPHLVAAGDAAIVNTASCLALQGDLRTSAYSASKAGLISLTRSLAVQYGKRGVRANAIAVGLVMSDALSANMPPPAQAMMLGHHLTPYLGHPDHIANVVSFLASHEAAYVTGQVMVVDGGVTAHVAQFADIHRMMSSVSDS